MAKSSVQAHFHTSLYENSFGRVFSYSFVYSHFISFYKNAFLFYVKFWSHFLSVFSYPYILPFYSCYVKRVFTKRELLSKFTVLSLLCAFFGIYTEILLSVLGIAFIFGCTKGKAKLFILSLIRYQNRSLSTKLHRFIFKLSIIAKLQV